MQILIFANGIIEEVEWIRPYLTPNNYIIAANGGSRHLHRLETLPNLLIGDLDSISTPIRQWLDTGDTSIIGHRPAKNETDLELALLHAVQKFPAAPVLLFGMVGGRLDQTLANILLLTHPALRGHSIRIMRQEEEAWLITDDAVIRGDTGDTVSLIPLGGDAHIRTTTGLQWPLQDEPLLFGPARGISNTLTADTARITIESGLLLCVHRKQNGRHPAA